MARKQNSVLSWAEYISADNDQNIETAAARWQFMQAVQSVYPRFFTKLQQQIYPTYSRLAGRSESYWQTGWAFETWQLHSDRNQRLTAPLSAWAKPFNAEEAWILEGALQSLWLWRRFPAGLNVRGAKRRDRITLHSLRHTFASWLAIAGLSLRRIQELLGHKSIVTTERYSHLGRNGFRSYYEELAKAMGGGSVTSMATMAPLPQGLFSPGSVK